jgi:hypothetical protein
MENPNYIPLILIGVLIGTILAFYFSPKARQARAQRKADREQAELALQTQAQNLFELFASGDGKPLPNLTNDVQGVILRGDEACCALSRNAQHIVSRTKTRYVGGSQGVSIRIMKGVRYHVGAYRGHPVKEEFETVADVGSVYVTNKRFIFAGNKEVTSVPIAKIADVHLDGARVVVIVENKANPMVVGVTQPYWAPVIAAAAQRMASA